MDIMHASDLHYAPENLVEADRCFGFAVNDAIARNVSVAIISGDSTHHKLDAHSPAFIALAKRIKQLADHCPVFMLQGMFFHEPHGMLRILAMLGAKHPIIISDTIEMIGLRAGQWLPYNPNDRSKRYDLVITSIPTMNKADLALTVGPEHAGMAMGEHIAAILASFGPVNRMLRHQGIPTVLVTANETRMHFIAFSRANRSYSSFTSNPRYGKINQSDPGTFALQSLLTAQ